MFTRGRSVHDATRANSGAQLAAAAADAITWPPRLCVGVCVQQGCSSSKQQRRTPGPPPGGRRSAAHRPCAQFSPPTVRLPLLFRATTLWAPSLVSRRGGARCALQRALGLPGDLHDSPVKPPGMALERDNSLAQRLREVTMQLEHLQANPPWEVRGARSSCLGARRPGALRAWGAQIRAAGAVGGQAFSAGDCAAPLPARAAANRPAALRARALAGGRHLPPHLRLAGSAG